MNLRKIARQLQTALCQQGRRIKINQIQYYSERTERMGTMYIVSESVYDDEQGKNVTHEYCSSPKLLDVVQTLHALYKGGE